MGGCLRAREASTVRRMITGVQCLRIDDNDSGARGRTKPGEYQRADSARAAALARDRAPPDPSSLFCSTRGCPRIPPAPSAGPRPLEWNRRTHSLFSCL
eukprot:2875059-Pyramimonas_sp.AAC.1